MDKTELKIYILKFCCLQYAFYLQSTCTFYTQFAVCNLHFCISVSQTPFVTSCIHDLSICIYYVHFHFQIQYKKLFSLHCMLQHLIEY